MPSARPRSTSATASLMRWLGPLLTALLSACGLTLAATPAEAAEPLMHGPFEIRMLSQRIAAGGFPNTSANPLRTTEINVFELRHQGQPVQIAGLGTRFWRVLRLPDAPRPALLVLSPSVHLLSDTDGRLQVQSFPAAIGDMPPLQWLDEVEGQPGARRYFGQDRQSLETDTVLRGGRLLRIGNQSVLDIATLEVHRVPAWISARPDGSDMGVNASTVAAAMLSPRKTRFVLPTQARRSPGDSREQPTLLVVDIAQGSAYALPVDPVRMRLTDAAELDARWIAYHFEWASAAGGSETLRPRASFKPWPRKGRLLSFGPELVEYRVAQARPELAMPLARLLQQLLQARPEAGVRPQGLGSYAIDSCAHRLKIGHDEQGLSLAAPTASAPPWVRCQDELRRVAKAFDEELASGRHDDLFVAASPASGR